MKIPCDWGLCHETATAIVSYIRPDEDVAYDARCLCTHHTEVEEKVRRLMGGDVEVEYRAGLFREGATS